MSEADTMPEFLIPGTETELGTHRFTTQEIVDFAKKYDRQPYHLSEEAAKASVLGGLCASGWHTAAVWMRMQRKRIGELVKERQANGLEVPEFGPSPGFKNMKWLRPVYAGDHITFHNRTIACRNSQSKPGWKVVTSSNWGMNQDGEPVFTFEATVFVKYPA